MRAARAFAFCLLTASVGLVGVPLSAATTPLSFVIVLTDDQTFDALAPGAPVAMPKLEARLADPSDHWIDFPNFFFENPLCCPSRATILTGLYSQHTGVESNTQSHLFDDSDTLATRLDAVGYRTALIGKYLNGCSLSGRVLTCSWGQIGAGSSKSVTISVTPTSAGMLTATASASSTSPDPVPGNNSATATTLVT